LPQKEQRYTRLLIEPTFVSGMALSVDNRILTVNSMLTPLSTQH
jgi:hypothetical protein